jgi:hypothetical protein
MKIGNAITFYYGIFKRGGEALQAGKASEKDISGKAMSHHVGG